MANHRSLWAIVLAGGDGTRLSALTTDELGRSIPKQYCSLSGGPCLLQAAIRRARQIVSADRVCVVVAHQHRALWSSALAQIPAANIFVEPRNLGTAHGVLHAVLAIRNRDTSAAVLFLPADHFVGDEPQFAESIRDTVAATQRHTGYLCLLGIDPDTADPELGYVIPGDAVDGSTFRVDRFIEKPDPLVAQRLIGAGALWNSFIFSASCATTLELLRRCVTATFERMGRALERPPQLAARSQALEGVYRDLPSLDFSRDVVQGAEGQLRVVRSAGCGWTDLGTPGRVARALQWQSAGANGPPRTDRPETGTVNLATRLDRLLGDGAGPVRAAMR